MLVNADARCLPPDELSTYRSRVAAVTADGVERVAQALMPVPDQVAVVVVGKAAEIRQGLEAKFGPLRTMAPADCENLSAVQR